MNEIWKPILIVGKEHRWYSVSNYGNLISHLKPGSCDFDENYSYKMKLSKSVISRTRIYVPHDFVIGTSWEVKDGHTLTKNNTSFRKDIYVYQLVMWTFKPIDLYPPKLLEKCWSQIPEDAKNWIRQTVYINHIDHDRTNNHIDNLEYVTPMNNTREAVKHYGGNLANKKLIADIGASSHKDLKENFSYNLYPLSTIEGFF